MRRLIASAGMFFAVAAAGPVLAAPQVWQEYGAGSGVIRCESQDGRVRECPTGGRQVVLERQLSRSACIEGRSWGYGRHGIWVAQGCRADFRIVEPGSYGGGSYGNPYGGAYPGGSYGSPYGGNYPDGSHGGPYAGQTFRCESNDNRVQRCATRAPGRVQLVRQISRSACIEGRTWGSDRGSVWVSQGCRADFASTGRGNAYGYGNSYGNAYGNEGSYGGGRLFRCESIDGRTRECAVNTRAGVQLVRQLSNAACVQGRTWGYGRNGIWVSQGCRAEFRGY